MFMTTKPLSHEFLNSIRATFEPVLAERRAATPHIVRQPRLLQSEVGDSFYDKIAERREWIAKNCVGEFMLDELRDQNGVEIGRVFRFSDYYDAFHFRLKF